jgi:hypothetical protein
MDGNELVEKMRQAWVDAEPMASGSQEQYWTHRMAAAAKVCIDEALGEPTEREWCHINCFEDSEFAGYLRKFLKYRKARLLAPKTAEERVTIVEWVHDRSKWIVLIDGINMANCATFGKNDFHKAEIYRRGLIAELKEQHS